MCGNIPVGCTYNMACGDAMWSLFPLFPFVGCYSKLAPGQGWANLKGDNHLYKVDAASGTLACFFQGCEKPACICSRAC